MGDPRVLPYLVVGLVTGSLYGISGVGLVLVYRTTGVFNLANGAVAALAAYLFYALYDEHGVPWAVAAAICVLGFGPVAGVLLEVIFRPLTSRSAAMGIVATVGLLLAVEGYLYLQFGDNYLPFPGFLPGSSFELGGVEVTAGDLITFIVPTMLTIALYIYMKRSRTGLAMRGVVNSARLVALTGTSPNRIRRTAWTIGAAFAGLSGILLAPSINLDANLLSLTVVTSFGAAALGFFKSLPRTYAGALVLGVAQSLSTRYLVSPPWNAIPTSLPFLILLVLLVTMHRRLPVQAVVTERSSSRPIFVARLQSAPVSARLLAAGGCAVLLIAIPRVVGFDLPLYTEAVIFALVFGAFSLLVSESGQTSLCQACFVAAGATTLSHLTTGPAHLPWFVALLLAGLVAVPLGIIVAISAVRLPGIYLALATFGFALLMQGLLYPSSLMFGSQLLVSAARPRFGPLSGSDTSFYYLAVLIVGVSLVVIWTIRAGRSGRFLAALSEAPDVLTTNGLNPSAPRLVVFATSAFFSGVAGGLFVTLFGSISGTSYGAITSLLWIAVLALGGRTFLLAAAIPAAALAVVPAYLGFFSANVQTLLFGLGALFVGLGWQERMHGALPRLLRRRGAVLATTTAKPRAESGSRS
jgi:branched-subunit amino acid ABC-type transport system permease component